MRPLDDIQATVTAIRAGNRRILARAITHIENETPDAIKLLDALYPHGGQARIIGITGAPGTGKSTVVNALTRHIRSLDQTVGIVAVDPSSPFSQGAVLGDRIRMQEHHGDTGVYIRSMASRGSLGGLARTSLDVVRCLDAAAFDVILLETVGAGQSEVAIASAAQTSIVVEAPGLGDDIQATKAGILEIADILVVNKADHPAAHKTIQVLKAMLQLGHRMQMVAHHGTILRQVDSATPPEIDTWQVPVLETIATEKEGIEAVYDAILQHQDHLKAHAAERSMTQLEIELANRLQATLLTQFLQQIPPKTIEETLQAIHDRRLTPVSAVQHLLTLHDQRKA